MATKPKATSTSKIVKKTAPAPKSKSTSTVKSVKATPKKSAPQKVEPEKMTLSTAIATTTKRNIALLVLLILAIIGVLLYQNKGLFVVATVNGTPIYRTSVISALEKQSGKTTLDSLITESLIMSEAEKMGKSVSEDEINAEVKKIEDSVKDLGQPLDDLLALQGMTRDQLIQQIKIQKLIEKLLADRVTVKDEEIESALSSSESFDTLSASEEAKLKSDIKTNLAQQKISELFPTWLEELKTRSNIKYFKNY